MLSSNEGNADVSLNEVASYEADLSLNAGSSDVVDFSLNEVTQREE